MRVFWDTNLFVYLFEDYGQLSEATIALHSRMLERADELYTSAFTVGELLTKPTREAPDSVNWYRAAVARHSIVVPFDLDAAQAYARIRQAREIRPPDAIQLACAAAGGADLFVTNDDRLSRKIVPGVPVLSSLSAVPI